LSTPGSRSLTLEFKFCIENSKTVVVVWRRGSGITETSENVAAGFSLRQEVFSDLKRVTQPKGCGYKKAFLP
jgi:hypothetical protein